MSRGMTVAHTCGFLTLRVTMRQEFVSHCINYSLQDWVTGHRRKNKNHSAPRLEDLSVCASTLEQGAASPDPTRMCAGKSSEKPQVA